MESERKRDGEWEKMRSRVWRKEERKEKKEINDTEIHRLIGR